MLVYRGFFFLLSPFEKENFDLDSDTCLVHLVAESSHATVVRHSYFICLERLSLLAVYRCRIGWGNVFTRMNSLELLIV